MNATEIARYESLWTAGNNAGNGFAPDAEDVDEAAENMGEVLHTRESTDKITIVRTETGAIVGIGGDGSGGGAWAVRLEAAPAIVVGSVLREHVGEDCERDELSAYVSLRVTIGSEEHQIGTMVGVRPSDQGSARASGCYASGPFLATWQDDSDDLDSIPRWAREHVRKALHEARARLWSEVEALRA